MTNVEFLYNDYLYTRKTLVNIINRKLSDSDKVFLLSFETGEPNWNLFPIPVLKDLPAIQWKLLNSNKLKQKNTKKHNSMIVKLKEVLYP